MAYIHTLKEWPLFRWDAETLAPALSRLRYAQGLFAARCLALDERARAEAARLTLARDTGGGLADVLADLGKKPESLLTASRILAWSKAAGGDDAWRSGEVEGAPAAARIPEEMKNFLAWFNFDSLPGRAESEGASLWLDPVIKAGLAPLWFMGIRPFSKGSGRLALAVCNLALLRADAGKPWYSLSEGLKKEKKGCRAALENSLRGDMDVTPWLAWFLGALERAVTGAEDLIAPALERGRAFARLRSTPLNRRQKTALAALLDALPPEPATGAPRTLSSGAYAEAAGCSSDTALRDIQELVRLGFLRRNRAGGRSTSYSLEI